MTPTTIATTATLDAARSTRRFYLRRGLLHLLVALPLLFVAASLRGPLVVQRLGGRLPGGVAIKRSVWARIGHRLRFPGLPAT
jgi:hypothetical protein